MRRMGAIMSWIVSLAQRKKTKRLSVWAELAGLICFLYRINTENLKQ